MPQTRTTIVLAAVERSRKRLWAHCDRMTGRRAEADDLSQEAIARAIERADDLTPAGRGRNVTYSLEGFDDPATQTTAPLLALPLGVRTRRIATIPAAGA